jgi:signal recognition particle GTPase
VLETLAKGFRAARQRLTGVAELGDEVIEDALRDVRLSLLEGDVEFRVVKRFLERVKEAARAASRSSSAPRARSTASGRSRPTRRSSRSARTS